MTANDDAPRPISWLTDWDAALAAARVAREPVLIDVAKDP